MILVSAGFAGVIGMFCIIDNILWMSRVITITKIGIADNYLTVKFKVFKENKLRGKLSSTPVFHV